MKSFFSDIQNAEQARKMPNLLELPEQIPLPVDIKDEADMYIPLLECPETFEKMESADFQLSDKIRISVEMKQEHFNLPEQLGNREEDNYTLPDFIDLEDVPSDIHIGTMNRKVDAFSTLPQYYEADKNGDRIEDSEDYHSTLAERINHTPKEGTDRGEWDGERGNSVFIPFDNEIVDLLAKYGLEGIRYTDGIPDFSEIADTTVEIGNMSDNRAKNFRECDEACAKKWNDEKRDGRTDWTPEEVAKWRKQNGYTWHERNDMKTCDLVPSKIHGYFTHLGGVSECRKRDAGNVDGGAFDE